MSIQYVTKTKTQLRTKKHNVDLLWGDPCHIKGSATNGRRNVVARDQFGSVDDSAVNAVDPKLLELYIIDVGQGDGILLKTPDGLWHLIDAGVSNEKQTTKQGAANFLRWKFFEDLKRDKVELENVILTHPDFDHYGGLTNVFDGRLPAYGTRPERTFDVEVKNFYHNGLGRYIDGSAPLGARQSGKVPSIPNSGYGVRRNGSFITELLDGKGDFQNPPRTFTDEFQELADRVVTTPTNVKRLSRSDGFLPGYAPGESDCVIHVLGPILETTEQGFNGLRWISSKPKTSNGHSVVLRIDHGDFRCLLTGDLNDRSQRLLLAYVDEDEFAADVAKGCHHGADDVDLDFIKAIGARATVISSGDNENYSHPRPRILGASAYYGRRAISDDNEPMPPLLYSTELARSVELRLPAGLRVDVPQNGGTVSRKIPLEDAQIDPEGGTYRDLGTTPLATNLVYGLVNVRTDGNHILIATLEESGHDFDVRVMRAGVS